MENFTATLNMYAIKAHKMVSKMSYDMAASINQAAKSHRSAASPFDDASKKSLRVEVASERRLQSAFDSIFGPMFEASDEDNEGGSGYPLWLIVILIFACTLVLFLGIFIGAAITHKQHADKLDGEIDKEIERQASHSQTIELAAKQGFEAGVRHSQRSSQALVAEAQTQIQVANEVMDDMHHVHKRLSSVTSATAEKQRQEEERRLSQQRASRAANHPTKQMPGRHSVKAKEDEHLSSRPVAISEDTIKAHERHSRRSERHGNKGYSRVAHGAMHQNPGTGMDVEREIAARHSQRQSQRQSQRRSQSIGTARKVSAGSIRSSQRSIRM